MSCNNEEDEKIIKQQPEDIYVVDIRNDTDWGFWAVDVKNGDFVIIKEVNLVPSQALVHVEETNQDYHVFFNETGQLSKIKVDDYILSFGNFRGTKLDLGVLHPDGTTQVIRDIETGIDLSANPFANGRTKSDIVQILNWTGISLKAVSCLENFVKASPWALWDCNLLIMQLIVEYEASVGMQSTLEDFVKKLEYIDTSISTFKCLTGGSIISCLEVAVAVGEEVAKDVESKSQEINLLNNNLNFNRIIAYDFNSNLIDLSNNQHDGTVQGNPFYQENTSGRGKAASFNNSWQVIINKSTPTDFALAGDWTIAFSIKPENNVDWGNGFIQRIGDNGLCNRRGPIILINNGSNPIPPICGFHGTDYFDGNGKADNPVINGIQYGSWNRIIFVHRANNTGDIYVNGIKTHSNISMKVADFGTKKMSLGGNYLNDGCYGQDFANNIMLDDFALFGMALTEAQVSIDKLSSPIGF
jgi:hypothetical protein